MDFAKIFLTSRDNQMLQALKEGRVVQMHLVDAENLMKLGFAAPYSLGKGYVITGDGLRYCEYLQKSSDEKARSERNDRIAKKLAYIGAITGVSSLLWQVLNTLLQ